MTIIQISLIGIVCVLIALQFKSVKGEYATLIMIVAGVIIFGFGVSKLEQILASIKLLRDKLSVSDEYLSVLIKILGISYICEFSADICKDSGFTAISNQIQIFGKLSILVVSMPIFMNLLNTIWDLV
jgi:stage III sporulation protein AD